nr:uncharacterized protein LOC129388122 [Dermacentor andersoni]
MGTATLLEHVTFLRTAVSGGCGQTASSSLSQDQLFFLNLLFIFCLIRWLTNLAIAEDCTVQALPLLAQCLTVLKAPECELDCPVGSTSDFRSFLLVGPRPGEQNNLGPDAFKWYYFESATVCNIILHQ